MARNFLTRSEIDAEDSIVDALAGRENELASYDANIDAYTQQLVAMDAVLPSTWDGLEQYKGKSGEQVFTIGGTPEQQALAAKMNHRERVRMLLFTEQVECSKSEAAYQCCVDKLPVDKTQLTAALDRYFARTTLAQR